MTPRQRRWRIARTIMFFISSSLLGLANAVALSAKSSHSAQAHKWLSYMTSSHAQNSADAGTVIQHGWCARHADGSPYRHPGWRFPGALLPDFTSSEVRKWWLDHRRFLVEEMSVDGGFKTDVRARPVIPLAIAWEEITPHA